MNSSEPKSAGNLNDNHESFKPSENSSVVFTHTINENKRRSNNSVLITIIICATVIVLCVLGFILYYAVLDKEAAGEKERVETTDYTDRSDRDDDDAPRKKAASSQKEESSRFDEMSSSSSANNESINRKAAAAILTQVDLTDDYSYIICEVPLEGSDLQNLTKAQLRILRNTIYARHGRKFKSADLRNYFSSFDWYTPRYDEISPNSLSPVEKHNILLIQKYE